jgi:dienelactone hydrolase
MVRRIAVTGFVLAVLLGITISRCDPRQPGAAAAPQADAALEGGVVRQDVRFPCGDTQCAAWLYRPHGERPPVVVMAHGFAGTRDVALPAFAERFARAGIAALVFDYRHFGASGGLPRQIVDPQRQLDDWRAALAWARTRADLDGNRTALWGSSLGGGHALTIAAEDPALAAVVAQAPLIDTQLEGEATFYGAGWAARLLLSGWADCIASAYGGGPITIPVIAPAGRFGMIVDDAAFRAFERLVSEPSSYRNAVAARSVFLFDDYNPAAVSAAIRAPVLLIASPSDRFAPYAAVQACATQAGNAAVAVFDGDHFDVYSPPASEQAGKAATDFLTRHLLVNPPDAPAARD